VTVQLLHLGDFHFGGGADVRKVEALEGMLPDLRPDAIVVSGDLSQRARHGEFQRARAFVRLASRSAPVLVQPGNHDVEWWRRPLLPFGRDAIYRKYRLYFGEELAPTLAVPGAVIASVLTAHGLSWGSLTFNPRDMSVKGHLPKREIERARRVFGTARPTDARVLVVHHNVLRGGLSLRMGLSRWRRAQRRIVDSGADVVLCGHDHQEAADLLGGKVVVSTTSTLSTRSRGGRPASFNFLAIDQAAVQVTFFRWEAKQGRFRSSDTVAFARQAKAAEQQIVSPQMAAT
jgi:3',5'-cyclic AMP phosphodiesterase CpdA